MEGNEIDLDLDKVELQGWEDFPPAYTIAEYAYRILKGETAPRVEVVFIEGIYQIVRGRDGRREDSDYDYGGHKRGISYLIAGKPLPCSIIPKHRYSGKRNDFFPVREICIEGGGIPKDFFRNIPEDVTKRFLQRWVFRDFHGIKLSDYGIEHLVSSHTTHP